MTMWKQLRPKCALTKKRLDGRHDPRNARSLCAAMMLPWTVLVIAGCGSGVTTPNPESDPSLDEPLTTVDPEDVDPGAGPESSTPAAPVFTARRTFCCNPLTIIFSVDSGGEPLETGLRIDWNFGDGKHGTGASIEHTYARAGRYRVVMLLTRMNGQTLEVSGVVDIGRDSAGDNVLIGPSAEDAESDGGSTPATLVARAGGDITALPGARVVLDGRASSWSGSPAPLTAWSQTEGPAVALRDANKLVASFDAPDENGHTLVFTLTLRQGALESTDQVHVQVADSPSGEHAPRVYNARLRVAPGEEVIVTLTGTDEDDDDLTFSILTAPRQGQLGAPNNADPSSATIAFTADPAAEGEDFLEFDATDGRHRSNVGRVAFTFDDEGNEAPNATDSEAFVPVNTEARVRLSGDDLDGDPLTFEIVTPPLHGRILRIENDPPSAATVVYAPDRNYYGQDSLTFRVSDGREYSQPATVRMTLNKLVLPWNEVNAPDDDALKYFTHEEGAREGMTVLDFAVKGIREWGHVTNAIIITTNGSRVGTLYERLKPNLPSGMRVIGGFKTASYLPPDDFAHPDGWLTIRDRALTTARSTGVNIVVLENETALTEFNTGRADIDFDRLHASLTPLADTGLEVWWWMPAVLRDRDYWGERREKTAALVQAVVNAVPKSRFITGYTGWLDWRRGVFDEPELRDQMILIVGENRFFDRHLVTRTGRRQRGETEDDCYTAGSSLEAMSELINDQIVLYPGASQWILTGEDYRAALPELARVPFPFK